MTYQQLVHSIVISDNPLSDEQIEELFSYLEVQLSDGTNVRVKVTHNEQI